tara:strand:- start:250 stop:354 length:105 start_codon:yes stop_codon:yes gene_type:complete
LYSFREDEEAKEKTVKNNNLNSFAKMSEARQNNA